MRVIRELWSDVAPFQGGVEMVPFLVDTVLRVNTRGSKRKLGVNPVHRQPVKVHTPATRATLR